MTSRADKRAAMASVVAARGTSIGPTELAAAANVSKSTAHAFLTSLQPLHPRPLITPVTKAPTMADTSAPTLSPIHALQQAAAPPVKPAPPSASDPILAALQQAQAALTAAASRQQQLEAEAKQAALQRTQEALEREAAELAASKADEARRIAEAQAKDAADAQARAEAMARRVSTANTSAQDGDAPPLVSRWQPIVPTPDAGWVGRKGELAMLNDWLNHPEDGPVGLTGPKGSGKTSLLREACARSKRPFLRINGHRDMAAADLVGTWIVRADRSLAWNDGPVPAAMRSGTVLLVDEFDRIPSGTASVLQAVMEGDALTIPETGEVIHGLPGFALCLSANSIGDRSGQYAATLPVDAATLDRLGALIRIDPMGRSELRRMLKARVPTLTDDWRERCLLLWDGLAEAHKKGDLGDTPSPRRLLSLGRYLARGVLPELALAAALTDRLDAAEGEAVRAYGAKLLSPPSAELAALMKEAAADAKATNAAKQGGAA